MAHEEIGIGRVDEGLLGGAGKENLRVAEEILVQGVGHGNKDNQGLLLPSPHPAGLLPGRGDGARETGNNTDLQVAHVDPQFQGIGGHNPQEPPGKEGLFNLPPLPGQVTTPVGNQFPV